MQSPDTLNGLPGATSASGPDTLIGGQFRNARLGFNSFLFQNQLFTAVRIKEHYVTARAGQDWLYNLGSGGGGRFIQRDYFGGFRHIYQPRAAPHFHAGQEASAVLFLANGNRLASYHGLLGYGSSNAVKGTGSILAEGLAGVAYDQRGEIRNTGPSVAGRLYASRAFAAGALQTGMQTFVRADFISPRLNAVGALQANAVRRFAAGSFIEAVLVLRRRRLEDYLARQIQSIQSDTLQGNLNFGTQLGSGFYLRSNTVVLAPNRTFRYRAFEEGAGGRQDTRYTQLEARTRTEVGMAKRKIRLAGSVELGQRNRAYRLDNNLSLDSRAFERASLSERSKDIQEYTVSWQQTIDWAPTRRSNVRLATVQQLFRVNTPSELNDQDRDEALYTADVQWSYRWLGNLRTVLRASGGNRHNVFITNTQSAQNYIERILRFEPQLQWQLGRLSLNSTYGVWATYNVRDFEAEQDKNRANRVLILQQQATLRLWPRAFIAMDWLRRENRIALLRWHDFSESPIDTVVVTELHPRVGQALYLGANRTEVRAQLGYKMFRQQRNYVGGVKQVGVPTRQASLKQITLQHGPWASILLAATSRVQLEGDFWLQYATTRTPYRIGTETFAGQSFSREELDVVSRRVYAFFNMTGSFLF